MNSLTPLPPGLDPSQACSQPNTFLVSGYKQRAKTCCIFCFLGRMNKKNGWNMQTLIFLSHLMQCQWELYKNIVKVSPRIRRTTWFGSAWLHSRALLALFEKATSRCLRYTDWTPWVNTLLLMTYDPHTGQKWYYLHSSKEGNVWMWVVE